MEALDGGGSRVGTCKEDRADEFGMPTVTARRESIPSSMPVPIESGSHALQRLCDEWLVEKRPYCFSGNSPSLPVSTQ